MENPRALLGFTLQMRLPLRSRDIVNCVFMEFGLSVVLICLVKRHCISLAPEERMIVGEMGEPFAHVMHNPTPEGAISWPGWRKRERLRDAELCGRFHELVR